MKLKPFLVNVPILLFYPLKTPYSKRFCGVFRGCKMETLVNNELINEAFITFSETFNTGLKKEKQQQRLQKLDPSFSHQK